MVSTNPTFVSWLIQKKSGKTPLETIPLYIKLARGHVNGAEIPVAIINRKNIADWCFNYRKILATPSFFCGKAISFNFTADLYIFPHLTRWGYLVLFPPDSVIKFKLFTKTP